MWNCHPRPTTYLHRSSWQLQLMGLLGFLTGDRNKQLRRYHPLRESRHGVPVRAGRQMGITYTLADETERLKSLVYIKDLGRCLERYGFRRAVDLSVLSHPCLTEGT